jgi:hypothetical protein
MAELNFGLLNPPGSQSIGNAFVSGMDQALESRARDLQMQQSVRKGQMDELTYRKALDTEARLNKYYSNIAANGGPKTPEEAIQAMLGSGVPHIQDLAAKLQIETLKNDQQLALYRAAKAGPATTPTAVAAPMEPEPGSFGADVAARRAADIFAPPPVAERTNMMPGAAAAPADVNNLGGRTVPEMIAERDRMLEIPGNFAKNRVAALNADILRASRPPHTQTVDGQVIERQPDGTYSVVFGEKKQLPIVELQALLAKMPLNDPDRPALQADVDKALTAQMQGAARVRQGAGQLQVAQGNLAVNRARLKIAQDAPKLGLTDPADIERIAVAVADGRIPVDRLNSGTAKIYAGLLKANPELDFTNISIAQAGAKAQFVAGSRIAGEQTRVTSLTPEMIQQHSEAYNTTGKLPPLGSGAQAAVDRVTILRHAAENNPTDATTKALNKAQLDALVPLAKQDVAVTNYVKTFDKNIGLARAALDKISNTNIPALNAWLLNPAKRQLTGDPDLKALGVYVSSLQAEFAKIQSGAMGNSVTADAAIKRAQETINTADSPRAFRAALDAMVKESRNRLDSFEDTRKEMAAKVRGQPAPVAPGAATPTQKAPAAASIPQAAINDLKAGRGTPAQFDEQFGAGAAARVQGAK